MIIDIELTQKVTYSQQIEVTEEEYEILKEYNGTDVYNDSSDREAHNIITNKLDFSDILSSDDLYEDVKITK